MRKHTSTIAALVAYEVKAIASALDLQVRLKEYFAWLDENPIEGNGVVNEATGDVERPLLLQVPGILGFCLYLGWPVSEFLKLQNQFPEEFRAYIERIRQRLLVKAIDKNFAKMVADRPLLDLGLDYGDLV